MHTADEEQIAEVVESLRIAAEADKRLATLLSKFARTPYVPPKMNELENSCPFNF